MNKSFIKPLVVALLVLICASVFPAQSIKPKKRSSGERLITAFANSKTLPGLFRADEGVLSYGQQGISPDVIRILKLGKRAIPLLIGHLDDKRHFTNMVACCWTGSSNGDGTEKVSVSEGVLFILKSIIRQTSQIYNIECLKQDHQFAESNDDCIRQKYFSSRNMKRNWLKAYRAGKIHYKKYEY